MPPGVVISGIGVVSPFGVGRETYWDHISRGVSGTKAITQFDASTYPCQVAAWVPPVSIEDAPVLDGDDDGDGRADPKRYSRAALFGVVAAREAWQDAGLRAGQPGAGVLIGSGGGGIDVGEKQYEDFFLNGGKHVTPYAIAVGIAGMVSSEISISLGLRGLSHVLSCGCTSSTDAIGYASALIRAGEYDMLLSGGTDGCVLPGMIFGFSRMRAVSTRYNDRPDRASRPFDRGRDGFVLGEGAGVIIMERAEHARARGAEILGYVAGYGASNDAFHMTQPDRDGRGAEKAMRAALADAGAAPQDVGYINAHGTSTPFNDRIETVAIHSVFNGGSPPVSSTKSAIGHLLGAAGAVEAVATLEALRRGLLPPTLNFEEQDPDCDLDYVPDGPREAPGITVAMSNSFGFGGQNACLVFRKAT